MAQHSDVPITDSLKIEDICLQAVERIEALHALLSRDVKATDTVGNLFANVKRLLDALPLNTEEFGLAGNRLRNADRYLRSRERGAACYELKLLSRSLRSQIISPEKALVEEPKQHR